MRKAEAYASLLNEIPQFEDISEKGAESEEDVDRRSGNSLQSEPVQFTVRKVERSRPVIYIDDEFLIPLENELGLPIFKKEAGRPIDFQDPEFRSRIISLQQAVRRDALEKEAQRGRENKLRQQTIEKLNRANRFFEAQRQQERLRQAQWSFNVALALLVIGIVIVLCGVGILLRGDITPGILSSAAGVVANISSAVVFKFNRDANDRLDKIQISIAKVTSLTKAVELIDKVEEDQPQLQI